MWCILHISEPFLVQFIDFLYSVDHVCEQEGVLIILTAYKNVERLKAILFPSQRYEETEPLQGHTLV